jgi:hypothetical protein
MRMENGVKLFTWTKLNGHPRDQELPEKRSEHLVLVFQRITVLLLVVSHRLKLHLGHSNKLASIQCLGTNPSMLKLMQRIPYVVIKVDQKTLIKWKATALDPVTLIQQLTISVFSQQLRLVRLVLSHFKVLQDLWLARSPSAWLHWPSERSENRRYKNYSTCRQSASIQLRS